MKTFIIFAKVVLTLLLVCFYALTIGVCFVMTAEAAVRCGTAFGVSMLITEIILVTIAYDLYKNEVFGVDKT